ASLGQPQIVILGPAPICMPNRQAFLTMRMNSVNGSHSNGLPLDKGNTTFVELMRAVGYHTALIGKSHLQTMTDAPAQMQMETHPAEELAPPAGLENARNREDDISAEGYQQERRSRWLNDPALTPQTPYYGFDDVIFASAHSEVADGHHRRHLDAIDPAISQGVGRQNSTDVFEGSRQLYASTLDPEQYPTHFVGQSTKNWLKAHAEEQPDAPFFLWCSFPDPHHPWTPPAKYYHMYDPADVELPDSFYESPRNQTESLRWAHAAFQRGARPPRVPFMAAEAEARKILAVTYGMITFIDEQIGEIVAQLEALGQAENTVIVFTSDHGDYMAHHGLFLKGGTHYQTLIKVPFIWCDADDRYNRGLTKGLASYVDIGRTVLQRAGLAPFHGHQGRSLLPFFAGEEERHRDRVLVEHVVSAERLGFPVWSQIRTVVTERYRLSISNVRDEGELYDLQEDPGEIVNLWESEKHVGVKAEMLFALAQEMADLADRSRVPALLA
ncbi:MAG: sulfatase-like hydrolase/transferase, partial [Chloroflexota bacterium]